MMDIRHLLFHASWYRRILQNTYLYANYSLYDLEPDYKKVDFANIYGVYELCTNYPSNNIWRVYIKITILFVICNVYKCKT